MLDKRAQGRPARGAATVGPKKIIEGMQDALRALESNNITRKDIARFAGVTPALVTYYFPERNTLIEAATLPVVESLSARVRERVSQDIDPHLILLNIISDLLACYSKDIAILELYMSHRRSLSDASDQDDLKDVSESIIAFFDDWLAHHPQCAYDGTFLTNALLGICRSVAYHHRAELSPSIDQDGQKDTVLAHAELIYRILVGVLPGSTLQDIREITLGRGPHDVGRRSRNPTSSGLSVGLSSPAGAREDDVCGTAAALSP